MKHPGMLPQTAIAIVFLTSAQGALADLIRRHHSRNVPVEVYVTNLERYPEYEFYVDPLSSCGRIRRVVAGRPLFPTESGRIAFRFLGAKKGVVGSLMDGNPHQRWKTTSKLLVSKCCGEHSSKDVSRDSGFDVARIDYEIHLKSDEIQLSRHDRTFDEVDALRQKKDQERHSDLPTSVWFYIENLDDYPEYAMYVYCWGIPVRFLSSEVPTIVPGSSFFYICAVRNEIAEDRLCPERFHPRDPAVRFSDKILLKDLRKDENPRARLSCCFQVEIEEGNLTVRETDTPIPPRSRVLPDLPINSTSRDATEEVRAIAQAILYSDTRSNKDWVRTLTMISQSAGLLIVLVLLVRRWPFRKQCIHARVVETNPPSEDLGSTSPREPSSEEKGVGLDTA